MVRVVGGQGQSVAIALEHLIPGADRITVRTHNDGARDHLAVELAWADHPIHDHAATLAGLSHADLTVVTETVVEGGLLVMVSRPIHDSFVRTTGDR